AVAGGAFGDISKGLLEGQIVSVKIIRIFEQRQIERILKYIGREALIWRQLSHPNLLPFLGLYQLSSSPMPCLVSPWMENGDLGIFLQNHPPDTDHTSLILDIALGLEYLHSEHIVHGDLKGNNILITPSRRACIADFGLSSVVSSRETSSSDSSIRGGTLRWQAPELILGESLNHFESDVYAFACVCYEILSGKVPFYDLFPEVAVALKVIEGARPTQPHPWRDNNVYNGIWKIMQDCWKKEPDARPTV
ncbi:kinase-like domain-containing protein, partial [Mycena vulgaris]